LPQIYGLSQEHLADVEKMLPYLAAAGHYKYVSCLPHYLEAMRSLPTLAPRSIGSSLYIKQQLNLTMREMQYQGCHYRHPHEYVHQVCRWENSSKR
uniref:Uncharacterized protein n=1 Tax=Gasterosteus aculeatus aculeatus TaxID=481459 RepID=A0AAQ4QEP0_GASAC